MDWKLLWEALKLPIRLAIFAIISWLIVEIGKLNLEWGGLAMFLLTYIDRTLHLYWKDTGEGLRGLSPL